MQQTFPPIIRPRAAFVGGDNISAPVTEWGEVVGAYRLDFGAQSLRRGESIVNLHLNGREATLTLQEARDFAAALADLCEG